jgi:ATP-dependent exoDNAse (exonuclease V) alpha subunit
MTYQKINYSNQIYEHTVILIDEFTMLSQQSYDTLILRFPKLEQVFLFGDDHQLLNICGSTIDLSSFQINELTINYRTTDPIFQANLVQLRNDKKYDFITARTDIESAIRSNSIILSATNAEIARINKIGLELNPNPFNGKWKIDTPIMFVKDIKKFDIVNNDIGRIVKLDDKIHIDTNGTIVQIDLDSEGIQAAYSYTYHRIQGQTISSNIVLNTCDMRKFDNDTRKRMIYVGITRAQELKQLSILK